MTDSAEHLARLYMRQPWDGQAAMPYRHLLATIKRELHSPLTRCPECEEPYIPTLLSWPERTSRRRPAGHLRRRYLLCPFCGQRSHYPVSPRRAITFTPAQLEELYALYEAGYSTRQIGARMSCDRSTVLVHLNRAGKEVRPRGGSAILRGVPDRELEIIRFLYETLGWTQQQIAEYLHVTRSKVQTRARGGGMLRFGTVPRRKLKKKVRRRVPA